MVARQYAVWSALLVTLVACYWVSQQELGDEEAIVTKPSKPDRRKPIDTRLSSNQNHKQLFLRPADTAPPVDLFAPLTAEVGSAEDIAASQESTIPANPYSYAGKIQEDGEWIVFLTDGSNNFAVKEGEYLSGGWLLKRVETDVLTLVYRPMKHEVRLDIIGATL